MHTFFMSFMYACNIKQYKGTCEPSTMILCWSFSYNHFTLITSFKTIVQFIFLKKKNRNRRICFCFSKTSNIVKQNLFYQDND